MFVAGDVSVKVNVLLDGTINLGKYGQPVVMGKTVPESGNFRANWPYNLFFTCTGGAVGVSSGVSIPTLWGFVFIWLLFFWLSTSIM